MTLLDSNLLKDEKILYRTKKHLIIFFAPIFWTLATIICYFHSNIMIHRLAPLPAVLALLSWVNQLLTYYFSEFAITNIRVMMREGFFFRHTNETRLTTLANVSVSQSLLGQALNYGTVFINSFGGETDPFRDLESPRTFQKALQDQLYLVQKKP